MDTLTFDLYYQPPYNWQALSAFLGARTVKGVEEASESGYRRIVRIANAERVHTGWLEVTPHESEHAMCVRTSPSLAPALAEVRSRVTRLLDLQCDPAQIAAVLGPLGAANPGMRVPGAFDGFEVAIRAVLGQQVSVAAARTLAGRFAAAFGTPVQSPFVELSTAFPTAEKVANLDVADIASLGVLPSRCRTVRELAGSISDGSVKLTPEVDLAATIERLKTIPGIGEWTAQYIAMRALAWSDAFPHTDLGVMKALGERNPKRVLASGEAWRPWRAYAVMHLWAGGGANAAVR